MLLVVASISIGTAAQSYIKTTYRRWSAVESDGASGSQVARRMLDEFGCGQVGIKPVAGSLTDHYDPQDKNLYLSEENRAGGSVASVAVACHEAGHAVQHAQGFAMMRIRTALVPAVNFTQSIWFYVLLGGMWLNLSGLTTAAIVLFAFSVLFHLVTLPVEIDASRRAIAYIDASGMSPANAAGAREVLRAAALTYVAAALTSVLQLLYLIGRNRSRD
ncbi:zinc metallopeptidase [Collinsella sp. AGMB00827]|uniref:Zinc metallopeptidase n=1 Tax=Collinsella ureilytica TaxID=2869515 RepID=A0ABS7MHY4_9ACTN|nr:zinc metallopeptidase [Collinsella urealyticum]MBY4796974.1 zinc metallopeptidase [Collinsella urealyticum]